MTRTATVLDGLMLAMLYAVPLTMAWTVAGVHIALGSGIACAALLGLVTRRWPLSRTPADLPWIVFAACALLASLFAVDAARSFTPLKKVLLIPLVHVAAWGLATRTRARTALRLFVCGMAATTLISVLHFLWFEDAPGARLRGTTHYMTYAGLLLLAAPLAAAGVWRARGRWRWLYAGASAILLSGLLLTFTRSAWLGWIVACGVMLWRVRPKLVMLLPLLAFALLLASPAEYRERALSSFDPNHANNRDRTHMWAAGVEMWRAHPWTGVGLGDLRVTLSDYAAAGTQRIHGHLHNNWIQVLASMGTLGFLAFLWLMARIGVLTWRVASHAQDPETRALGVGVWGAFWGFQTMGLFEWNFGDVEVTIALYFLLGASWAAVRAAVASESLGTRRQAPLFQ